MNKVILMGRLTRDPEVRYSQGENPLAIARFTLAVDRRFKRDGEQSADFISCVAFGKQAEHAERYYRQGIKIVVCGRIQTGKLHQQGRREGIHNRGCSGRTGICREQSCKRCAYRWFPVSSPTVTSRTGR